MTERNSFTTTAFFASLTNASKEDKDNPFATITPAGLPQALFFKLWNHMTNAINTHFQTYYALNDTRRHRAVQEVKDAIGPSFDVYKSLLKDTYSKERIPASLQEGSFRNYLAYLLHFHGKFWKGFFQKPFPLALPSKDRERGVYIAASSGSGKSEVLKNLVLNIFLKNSKEPHPSILVIDIHGDMAEELVRQRLFSLKTTSRKNQVQDIHITNHLMNQILNAFDEDGRQVREVFSVANEIDLWLEGKARLIAPSMTLEPNDPHEKDDTPRALPEGTIPLSNVVYFHPMLDKTGRKYPRLNPLDLTGKNLNAQEVSAYAQRLAASITSMLDGEATLSVQMLALLHPSLCLLLNRPGSTLWDLKRMMVDGTNEGFVALGKKLENPIHRDFFTHEFRSSSYGPTKKSISGKLLSLLNDPVFQAVVSSPRSSIDLSACMNTPGTLFVANLSSLGPDTAIAIGKLLIAMSFTIATQRINVPMSKRTRTHLVIDEAGPFLQGNQDLEAIMVQARKWKLHLTIAQQFVGQGMSSKLLHCVLGNTETKFVGKTSHASQSIMSKNMLADMTLFQNLTPGQFVVKSGSTLPALRLQMTDATLGLKTACSETEWKKRKQFFLERYYTEEKRKALPETVAQKDQNTNDQNNEPTPQQVRIPKYKQNPDPQ